MKKTATSTKIHGRFHVITHRRYKVKRRGRMVLKVNIGAVKKFPKGPPPKRYIRGCCALLNEKCAACYKWPFTLSEIRITGKGIETLGKLPGMRGT